MLANVIKSQQAASNTSSRCGAKWPVRKMSLISPSLDRHFLRSFLTSTRCRSFLETSLPPSIPQLALFTNVGARPPELGYYNHYQSNQLVALYACASLKLCLPTNIFCRVIFHSLTAMADIENDVERHEEDRPLDNPDEVNDEVRQHLRYELELFFRQQLGVDTDGES